MFRCNDGLCLRCCEKFIYAAHENYQNEKPFFVPVTLICPFCEQSVPANRRSLKKNQFLEFVANLKDQLEIDSLILQFSMMTLYDELPLEIDNYSSNLAAVTLESVKSKKTLKRGYGKKTRRIYQNLGIFGKKHKNARGENKYGGKL
uniref:Uncharacterized protein n=1 Tax=Panagrolaimus sp. ES5 TaxID=591445 RepID=A0AC34EZJ2_9BILA